MIKTVIDTNVMISALIKPTGKPRQLISCLDASEFELFYPEQLLLELRHAPAKRRLLKKLTHERVEAFIELLEHKGHMVAFTHIPPISRDSKDDAFLACAVACQAQYLVTGDNDLLCLKEYMGIAIVSPADFLRVLAE